MRLPLHCLLAALGILAAAAAAQETCETMIGVVGDPRGSVVAGVTIANTDTNASVRVASKDTGHYEAVLLLPGPHSVAAESAGFKRNVHLGSVLQVTDRQVIVPSRSRRHASSSSARRRRIV